MCLSIWDFSGNVERRWAGPDDAPISSSNYVTNIIRNPILLGDDYGGIDGRMAVRDEIDLMTNPPGQTVIWDSIGGAYEDLKYHSQVYPDYCPVLIVISDGPDVQSSDSSVLTPNKIEGASDFWCPWSEESNGTITYPLHRGKYTLDIYNPSTSTQWLDAMNHGGAIDLDRQGLLSAQLKIFTVGLGIEHHDNPSTPDVVEVWNPTIDIWPGEILDNLNARCIDTTVSPPCIETGTHEYNLWRISNTSGADYFYTDIEDLDDTMEYMGQLLSTTPIEYYITLQQGWNLISTPLVLTNWSLLNVFETINGSWDYIQTYEPLGPDYWDSYITYRPQQLNDLFTINNQKGYWINVTEGNVTLTLYGSVPISTTIFLHAGWNLVGYPTLNDSITIANAFLGTGADRVMVCDISEPYHLKEVGPSHVMKPGEGYWVHVTADTTWVVDW
jgi:hypothetical protein